MYIDEDYVSEKTARFSDYEPTTALNEVSTQPVLQLDGNKILIVDDQIINQMAIQSILITTLGIDKSFFDTATNGAEAL